VHCTELHRASFTPHVNDWFNFELKQDRNEKRPQAVNVRKCTAAETAQEQAWASRNLARFVSVNEIARKGELVCGGA
jgi:hypothetical protein